MRESLIEKAVVKHGKDTGWWSSKFTGSGGVPDRVFIKQGKVIFIEFKATGEKPRALQVAVIGMMKDKYADVYVVDDIDNGKGILDNA